VVPRGEPVTSKVWGPAVTDAATLIVKSVVAPPTVGVTGLGVKLPQVIPAGRVALTQDRVTACAVPAARVAVIVAVPELPCVMLTGPLFDNE